LQRDFWLPDIDVAIKAESGEITGIVATLPFIYSTSP